MNQDIKKKWIKALRSGKYTQARTQLKTDNGYCCLGVLCDLHAAETGTRWQHQFGTYCYLDNTFTLSDTVCKWSGLQYPSGRSNFAGRLDGERELTGLNDAGQSFSQIADVIEKEL